jgi:hypothetical protein
VTLRSAHSWTRWRLSRTKRRLVKEQRRLLLMQAQVEGQHLLLRELERSLPLLEQRARQQEALMHPLLVTPRPLSEELDSLFPMVASQPLTEPPPQERPERELDSPPPQEPTRPSPAEEIAQQLGLRTPQPSSPSSVS